ncbi:MAG TPA: PIN domain-containing protein [Candidatus Dormibacteraeota bacterium]|nr:PIN domain-containing protein [Candidatus Dormibacteraeota bacterium]
MRTRPAGFEPSDTSIFAALAEPMARVLLDTTVLIDVLRGRPAAARLGSLRGQQDVPFVCALNVEEVIRGLRPGEEAGARRLFNGMLVAPLGRPEGELAGRWRRKYAARSVTLSQADCLVAAAAVGVGARLATGNAKDYPMPELVIEHWPVGR